MEIKKRRYWLEHLEALWEKRSVLWLSGTRRTGKTCICQSLPHSLYLDCELPSARRELADPEAFLAAQRGQRIVLDEIHRLPNPSELLKIAADHYPEVKIVATGSSTLGASSRFKDTLAGRKLEIWLPPMIFCDSKDLGREDLPHRLHRGGLPPFFLARSYPESEYREWIEAYWARDILELFRLERRYSFLRFLELLCLNSGGIFEATHYAIPCEVSRTTIANYLAVLEATHVAYLVRPFHSRRSREIIAAPKVYAFDTGFVSFFKGWKTLRREDLGLLWEHYVLNELMGRGQRHDVRYWRDKAGHEIDFVLASPAGNAAIECKWSADAFDPAGLKSFRGLYPKGKNYVVANDVKRAFNHRYGSLEVTFLGLEQLDESGIIPK